MPFATGSRRSNRWGSPTISAEEDEKFNVGQVQRQIENTRTRLEDAGVNVDRDTDQRNWFEKATNLPEGQNAFFDVLELLGRPGQAVMGGIRSLHEGGVNSGGAGNALQGAWQGFSGQRRTRGSELVRDQMGLDHKPTELILGTALEIGLDPLTYVPGGVLAKGAKAVGQGAKTVGGFAADAAQRIPGVTRLSENVIKPAAEATKDALGNMFVRDYKIRQTLDGGEDEFLERLLRRTENERKYEQENALRNTLSAAKSTELEAGTNVGRLMEKDLVSSSKSDDLLRDIMSGRPSTFNVIDGELKSFLDQVNRRIRSSPVVQNRIKNRESQLDKVTERLTKLQADLDSGKLTSARAGKVVGQIDRLNEAQGKIQDSLSKLSRGIEPIEQNGVFTVRNPFPSLYKKALGDQSQFIERISPKGSFSEIVKPEFAEKLTPIVNFLLTDGEMTTQYLKGTPELQELKRLFGSNARFAHNQKKGTTKITLNQKDPDKMFFGLQGGRTVIPEDLTNAATIKDPSGLQFDDIQFMDRINDVNIPRPVREMSEDPGIQAAAQSLTEQNDYIRNLAREKGIDIKEIEGYMRHVLSREERELRKKGRAAAIDDGRRGTGNPNKKILARRELAGSTEDVNERMGRDFFEPNAYFATAIGQKQLIDYMQAVDLRRKVLSNPRFARKYQKGEEIGPNEVLIDTNNYKFIKEGEDGQGFSGLLDEIGGQYAVTPQVKRVLDRYQRITTNDEGIKAFLRGFDAVNNTWKKLALFSPMYHVRNLMGAMFNNYVGGMSVPAVMRYTKDAVGEVTNAARGKESELYDLYRRQGLSSETLHNIEFLRSVDPEKQIEKAVERGSKTGGAKALSKVANAFETSREAGDFVDQVNRFALFKWAVDKGATPEQAAKKVREVQFDYSNLSPFEEGATRIIPFYRWMRFNMPFQIEQFIADPRKYAHVNKIRLNAQDVQGLNDENMPDWMKESFAIPVSGDEATGKGQVLGLNLPLADLTRLSDPLKTLIDSTGSILKTGPELALNRNMFYDRPIEQYEGQRVNFDLPGEALDFSLPARLAYLIEQLGGQPARMTSGYLKSKEDVDQAQQALQQTLGIATPLKPYDAQANEYYALREELQKLQDYIRFIEDQQGVDVRTLREINR